MLAQKQREHSDHIEEEPKILYVDAGEDVTLHLNRKGGEERYLYVNEDDSDDNDDQFNIMTSYRHRKTKFLDAI